MPRIRCVRHKLEHYKKSDHVVCSNCGEVWFPIREQVIPTYVPIIPTPPTIPTPQLPSYPDMPPWVPTL